MLMEIFQLLSECLQALNLYMAIGGKERREALNNIILNV